MQVVPSFLKPQNTGVISGFERLFMLEIIAERFTDCLIKNELIDFEDCSLVIYRLQLLIEKMIGLIIVLFIGTIHQTIVGLLLFWVCFSLLRKHSGGYHCKKSGTCLLVSLLTIWVGNEIIAHIPLVTNFCFIVLLIFAVVSLGIGSVNNDEIDWSKEEQFYSTVKTRTWTMFELIIASLLLFTKALKLYGAFIEMAIVINAISLIIGKFNERRTNHEAES